MVIGTTKNNGANTIKNDGMQIDPEGEIVIVRANAVKTKKREEVWRIIL